MTYYVLREQIHDAVQEAHREWFRPGSEAGQHLLADALTNAVMEVLAANEYSRALRTPPGPEAAAYIRDRLASRNPPRRAVPLTDAEADAELDRRLNALKEKP